MTIKLFGMLEVKCRIFKCVGPTDAAERPGILQLKEKSGQLKLAEGKK